MVKRLKFGVIAQVLAQNPCQEAVLAFSCKFAAQFFGQNHCEGALVVVFTRQFWEIRQNRCHRSHGYMGLVVLNPGEITRRWVSTGEGV
jgi:hypothetical protein